jgi:hypothetical protein
MRSIRHPLSGVLYDLETNGVIRVTAHDGKTGLFRTDGTYINGDLYFADPHLCGWIGGRERLPAIARRGPIMKRPES